jgi:predicted transcriptional regulator
MELHLTPEQEARLSELANSKGRAPETLAQEVLGLYLEHESRFLEAVKRGMASLDRGEYIDHEIVGERINPSAAGKTVKTLYNGITSLRKFPHMGRVGRLENSRELIFRTFLTLWYTESRRRSSKSHAYIMPRRTGHRQNLRPGQR